VLWAAWAVAAVYLLRALLLAWLSLRRVGERSTMLLPTVVLPLLLALAQVGVSQALARALMSMGLGAASASLVGLCGGLAAIVSLLVALRRVLLPSTTLAWLAEASGKLRRRLERSSP